MQNPLWAVLELGGVPTASASAQELSVALPHSATEASGCAACHSGAGRPVRQCLAKAGSGRVGATISSRFALWLKRHNIAWLRAVTKRHGPRGDVKYGEKKAERFCAGVKRGLEQMQRENLLAWDSERRLSARGIGGFQVKKKVT